MKKDIIESPETADAPVADDHLSHDIFERLLPLHRRWRKVLALRGIARTLLGGLLVIIVACAVDYVANLGFGSRLVLAFATYGSLALLAWHLWVREWFQPFSARRVAWLLEQAFPELNEEMISAVELADAYDQHISREMILEVLRQADIDLARMEPPRTFPFSWRTFLLPGVILALFAIAMLVPALRLPTVVSRVLAPSPRDASLGAYIVALVNPTDLSFNEGDTVSVEVRVGEGNSAPVELITQDDRIKRQLLTYNRHRDIYEGVLTDVRDNFMIWAEAGQIKSKTRTVRVHRRPNVDGFRVTYDFPAFTALEPLAVRTSSGDVKALRGTRVTLQIAGSKPLSGITMTMGGRDYILPLDDAGVTGKAQFLVRETTEYTLRLFDADGLANLRDLTYRVIAVEDETPTVVLNEPEADLNLDPDDHLALNWNCADDFGIISQELVLRFDDGRTPRRLTLPISDRSRTVELGDLQLSTGGSFEIFIQVADASNHAAESDHRTILVGGGRVLRTANLYLRQAEALIAALASAGVHLSEVHGFTQLQGPTASSRGEGEQHYLRMREQKEKLLDQALGRACDLSLSLKRDGFFPRNTYCAALLRRYIDQERLFALPALRTDPGEETLTRLDVLVALGREMAEALREKGRQHAAALELPLLERRLARLPGQETPETVASRLRETERKVARLTGDSQNRIQQRLATLKTDQEVAATLAACQGDLRHHLQLNQQARDNYQRLDKAAKEIAAKLIPVADQIRELADAAAADPSGKAWEHLAAVAEQIRRSGQDDPNASRSADSEAVGEALRKAAEDHDRAAVDAVADAVRILREDQDLQDASQALAAAKRDISALAEDVAALREAGASVEPLAGRVRAAELAVAKAAAAAEAAEKLHGRAELQGMQGDLAQARQQVEQARAAAEAGDANRLSQTLAAAEASAERADDRLAKVRDADERPVRLARKALDKMVTPASEKIDALREEVAASLAAFEEGSTPIGALLAEVDAGADRLDEIAEGLATRAMREIGKEDGDLDRAAVEIDLAGVLKRTEQKALKAAARELQEMAKAGSGADDPRAARVSEALRSAVAELGEAERLLGLHEAAERGELAHHEAETNREAVRKLAGDAVPEGLREEVDRLKALREARKRAEALQAIAKAAANQGAKTAAELARDTATVKRELLAALKDEDPTQFEAAAEAILDEASEAAADMVREVRAARHLARTGADAASIQEAQESLRNAEKALARALPHADALRDLVGFPPEPLETQYEQQVKPAVDSAIQQLPRGEPAIEALSQAARAADDLQDKLDRVRQGVAAQAASAEPDMRPPELGQALAEARAAGDRLDDLLTEAEIIQREQETLAAEGGEASTTESDPAQERRLTALAEAAREQQAAVEALVGKTQPGLAAPQVPMLTAAAETLAHLSDNVALADVEAARRNLDAYREDVAQAEEEAAIAEAFPPGPIWTPSVAMSPPDPARPWETDAPAEMRADPWQVPGGFSNPRDELPAAQEENLAERARTEPEVVLAEAEQLVDAARSQVQEAAQALTDKDDAQWSTAVHDLDDTVRNLEARRAALGQADFPAAGQAGELGAAKPFEAAEDGAADDAGAPAARLQAATDAAKALEKTLEQYDGDVKSHLQALRQRDKRQDAVAAAERAAGDYRDAVTAAAAEAGAEVPDAVKQQGEALAQQIKALQDDLAKAGGRPAQAAAQELAEAAERLAQGDAAGTTEALAAAGEHLATAVPAPSTMPLEPEARAAMALAAAVGNRDAVNKGEVGDYAAAEESMRDLAEALPPSVSRELAEVGAERFAEAREAQMDHLPKALATAIAKAEEKRAEAAPEQWPAAAESGLARARTGDFEGASAELARGRDQAAPATQQALDPVLKALDEAATEQEAQIAALPEPAQSAIRQAQQLADDADGVAQAMINRAREAALEGEYDDAAEWMRSAATRLPAEDVLPAQLAADRLAQADEEIYGAADDLAREGIRQLSKPNPEVLAAARQGDAAKAATLAEAAGEKTAAAAFREANAAREARIPPAAKQGLAALDQALGALPDMQQAEATTLQEARTAALADQFEVAAERAEAVAAKRRDEMNIHADLARLDDFHEQVVEPMTEVAGDVEAGRFRAAAEKLAALPAQGLEPAAMAIQNAEEAAQAVARGALRQAYGEEQPGSPAAQALVKTARELMAGDLAAARAAVEEAGDAGSKARAALGRLDALQATAAAEVQGALAATEAAEQAMAQGAQQALGARQQALAGLAEQSKMRARKADDDRQLLAMAGELIEKGNVPEALDLLGSSLGGRRLVPAVQDAFGLQVQPGVAARVPAEDGDRFAQAQADVRDKIAAAIDHAGEVFTNAQADQQAFEALQEGLTAAATDLEAGDAASALADVAEAMGASWHAQQAADAFAAAAQQVSAQQMAATSPEAARPGDPSESQPSKPGQPQPGQSAPGRAAAGAEMQRNVKAAVGALQQAQNKFAGANPATAGQARQQGSAHLDRAARRLDQAAAAATQSALASAGGAGSGEDEAEFSGGLGREDQRSGAWESNGRALAGSDREAAASQYSAYYREANQRYLEQVARESRKWQVE